jgi:aspartyl/glutamyl-tRNA(Asn/Gln) amidotransferase C subunit
MIDKSTIESLLALSRLKMEKEEQIRLAEQVRDIIGYFEVLKGYDTSQIDVDIRESVPFRQLRNDTRERSFRPDKVASFAVDLEDGHFSVPRILGDDDSA